MQLKSHSYFSEMNRRQVPSGKRHWISILLAFSFLKATFHYRQNVCLAQEYIDEAIKTLQIEYGFNHLLTQRLNTQANTWLSIFLAPTSSSPELYQHFYNQLKPYQGRALSLPTFLTVAHSFPFPPCLDSTQVVTRSVTSEGSSGTRWLEELFFSQISFPIPPHSQPQEYKYQQKEEVRNK